LGSQNLTGCFQKKLEKILAGGLGNWLDQKALNFTVGFWKKKFRNMDGNTFDLALKSHQGVSKHHPSHFQKKVLERFEKTSGRLAHRKKRSLDSF